MYLTTIEPSGISSISLPKSLSNPGVATPIRLIMELEYENREACVEDLLRDIDGNIIARTLTDEQKKKVLAVLIPRV